MVVTNRTFLGETERTIPWSRPVVNFAGSAGRVKGAKRDRSHAQRSEHGEDPPFDAPERPARMDTRWPDWVRFPLVALRNGLQLRGAGCRLVRSSRPKHHRMRNLAPPSLEAALQRSQLPVRIHAGVLALQPLKQLARRPPR